MWPDHAAYLRALRKPGDALPQPRFRGARVVKGMGSDPAGQRTPVHGRGAYAVVPKIVVGDVPLAFKLLTSEPKARECVLRYKSLQRALAKTSRSGSLLPVDVVEDGIYVDGVAYPVVLMPWVDAEALYDVVERSLNRRDILDNLASSLLGVADELDALGLAHGDLHAQNIRVRSDGTLVLVDYDAMYHRRAVATQRLELGHADYRHPRGTLDHYGRAMDNFVLWHLYLSIRALARDPTLWEFAQRTQMGLLFREDDFQHPDLSPLFSRLLAFDDAQVRAIARLLVRFLECNPLEVPRPRARPKLTCPWCGYPLDDGEPRRVLCACSNVNAQPGPAVRRGAPSVAWAAGIVAAGTAALIAAYYGRERVEPALLPDAPTLPTVEVGVRSEPAPSLKDVEGVSATVLPDTTLPASTPLVQNELRSPRPSPPPQASGSTHFDVVFARLNRCQAAPHDLAAWKQAVQAITDLDAPDGERGTDKLSPVERTKLDNVFLALVAQCGLTAADERWPIVQSSVTARAELGNVAALDILASVCISITPPVVDGVMPDIRVVADEEAVALLGRYLNSATGGRARFQRGCFLLATEKDKASAAASATIDFKSAAGSYPPAASLLAALSALHASSRRGMTAEQREAIVSDAFAWSKSAAERDDELGMYLHGLMLAMWRSEARGEADAWMAKAAGKGYVPAVEWCRRENVRVP